MQHSPELTNLCTKANDGCGGTEQATVSITVASANTDPTANDDVDSTDEDTPLVVAALGVLVNDTDVDGDPLTASTVIGPANGMLALNGDGSFTYTPNAHFNGSDSLCMKLATETGERLKPRSTSRSTRSMTRCVWR